MASQRPYSIRTRIKTDYYSLSKNWRSRVRDHIPLEQGLRHRPEPLFVQKQNVRDHIPLEQGLRRLRRKLLRRKPLVRDHIPLEQGLRLSSHNSSIVTGMSETIFH